MKRSPFPTLPGALPPLQRTGRWVRGGDVSSLPKTTLLGEKVSTKISSFLKAVAASRGLPASASLCSFLGG